MHGNLFVQLLWVGIQELQSPMIMIPFFAVGGAPGGFHRILVKWRLHDSVLLVFCGTRYFGTIYESRWVMVGGRIVFISKALTLGM